MSTRFHMLLRFAAAVVLVVACACSHEPKPDPLAALDNAYKSGLLTKEEYDAKRAALVAGAAPAPAPAAASVPAAAPAQAVTPAAPPPQASNAPPPVDTASAGGSGSGAGAAAAPPAAPSAPPPAAPSAAPSAANGRPGASAVAKGLLAQKAAVLPPMQTARVNLPLPAQLTPAPASATAPVAALTPALTAKVESKEKEEEPAVLAGCEDEEFKSGGQKEVSRFYAAPPEDVWKAAVATLNGMDFNIHKNTEKEIEATRRRNIGVVVGAGGEKVTLTLKKATNQGRSGTMVTGETKKSFVGRLAQRTWTDAVLAQMACKLREGK